MGPLIAILAALGVAVVWNQHKRSTAATIGGPDGTWINPFNSNGQSAVVPQYGHPDLTQFQQKQIQTFQQLSTIAGAGAVSGAAALGLTAAAATGVGAVVAAAIIAIGVLRGTAHLVADQWTDPVNGVQTKFGTALSAIVDAKDTSLHDGSATKTSVNYAKIAVQALYRQYRTAADQFALVDPDHRIVINNSYRTLDPLIAQIVSDMNGQIAALPY